MNVDIGTVAAQFLFWEYLFPIFGIGSLQCGTTAVTATYMQYSQPYRPSKPRYCTETTTAAALARPSLVSTYRLDNLEPL
jgi:hypothetical protein